MVDINDIKCMRLPKGKQYLYNLYSELKQQNSDVNTLYFHDDKCLFEYQPSTYLLIFENQIFHALMMVDGSIFELVRNTFSVYFNLQIEDVNVMWDI